MSTDTTRLRTRIASQTRHFILAHASADGLARTAAPSRRVAPMLTRAATRTGLDALDVLSLLLDYWDANAEHEDYAYNVECIAGDLRELDARVSDVITAADAYCTGTASDRARAHNVVPRVADLLDDFLRTLAATAA